MLSFRSVTKKYGIHICRRCINRAYHIHLRHSDCQYGNSYPSLCSGCQQVCNIVTGFTLTGHLKMLFK